VEKCGRARDATDDGIIRRMHAHCMLEDYGYRKHSEFVIFKDFKRQKWLREHALLLPYFPAHKTHRDFFVRNFRKK